MAEPKATRYGYSDGLLELGAKDSRIVALDGDLAKSTSSNRFQEKFPERFFEMGIAEQNMIGVAAGLAIAGKIPFASSYSVFVTGRAWEQMRTMVAYSNLNVKIGGTCRHLCRPRRRNPPSSGRHCHHGLNSKHDCSCSV